MQPRGAVLLLLVACCCATGALGRQLAQVPTPNDGQPEYFVRVDGLDFVQGCDKFYVAGWNQWEVVEAAAGAPSLSGASIPVNMTGPELVRTLMDEAVKNGLNVMRTWVHPVNPQYALQTAPGKYNEAVFRGLDYVISEAQKRGIKLILAFTSNWTPTGGLPEYLKWAGATQPVQFYTDPAIKDMYKAFVSTVINRTNTINGRQYKDDPTIMAWNLINEPRCKGCPNGTIANWVSEMAPFVKSLDSNHLLTVGEEGFYGCCKAPANPGVQWSEWAAEEGQDFIADHSSPAIDFAGFHGWVDNWQAVSEEFLRTWVQQHVADSQTILKKPVIFEEFGKWVNLTADPPATLDDRDAFYKLAYDLISQLEVENTALKGALFWQWYAAGQVAPTSEGGERGLYGVYTTDAAFNSVRENALVAKSLSTPLAGCTPVAHKAAEVPPAPQCASTFVNGTPGTGFEGPTCDIDINECVRGTDGCSPNAACVNSEGSYSCVCHWGYEGDGKTCTANERAIQELQKVYWSQPQGLSCDAGMDVEWPSVAPGYVYDPIGSFAFFNASGGGKFGSRANVTLLDCMAACQQQEGCESFVYNDVLEQCFLKRGQCPTANFCWEKEAMCVSENDRGWKYEVPCGFWRSYYRLDMDTDAACADYTFTPVEGGVGQPDPANLVPFKEFDAQLTGTAPQSPRWAPGTEPTAPREAAGDMPAPQLEPSAAAAAGPVVMLLDPSVSASGGPGRKLL